MIQLQPQVCRGCVIKIEQIYLHLPYQLASAVLYSSVTFWQYFLCSSS